jgi:hypothetical protein
MGDHVRTQEVPTIVIKEETPSKGNARQAPNFVQRDTKDQAGKCEAGGCGKCRHT